MKSPFRCLAEGCSATKHKGLGLCERHYQQQKRGVYEGPVERRHLSSDEERWERYVTPTSHDGCWEWEGPLEDNGYAKVSHDGGREWVHRWAYRLHVGPIPAGVEVRHTCDNPPCVRPAHLILGTHAENMNDMKVRGRSKARWTHCSRGHEYTEENTYWSGKGRVCRQCRRDGYYRRKLSGEVLSDQP